MLLEVFSAIMATWLDCSNFALRCIKAYEKAGTRYDGDIVLDDQEGFRRFVHDDVDVYVEY